MTLVVRAVASRVLAVAIPVALAWWGGLVVMRLADVPQTLSATPLWDVVMALGLAAGSALVHDLAVRVWRRRPPAGAAVLLVGLPLVLGVIVAQVVYAAAVAGGGIENGLHALSSLGSDTYKTPALALGILLGASISLALPLAQDASCRARDERARVGPALLTTLLAAFAMLLAGGAAHVVLDAVARDGAAHQLLLSLPAVGGISSFVVGLPLIVLLAGASRLEDHLQGWTPRPTPVTRAG